MQPTGWLPWGDAARPVTSSDPDPLPEAPTLSHWGLGFHMQVWRDGRPRAASPLCSLTELPLQPRDETTRHRVRPDSGGSRAPGPHAP